MEPGRGGSGGGGAGRRGGRRGGRNGRARGRGGRAPQPGSDPRTRVPPPVGTSTAPQGRPPITECAGGAPESISAPSGQNNLPLASSTQPETFAQPPRPASRNATQFSAAPSSDFQGHPSAGQSAFGDARHRGKEAKAPGAWNTAKGLETPPWRSSSLGHRTEDGASTRNQVLVQFLPPGLQRDEALAAHFEHALPGLSVHVSMSRGRKKTAKVTFASSADAQKALSVARMYAGAPLKMSLFVPFAERRAMGGKGCASLPGAPDTPVVNPGAPLARGPGNRMNSAVDAESLAHDRKANIGDSVLEWRNPAVQPFAQGTQEASVSETQTLGQKTRQNVGRGQASRRPVGGGPGVLKPGIAGAVDAQMALSFLEGRAVSAQNVGPAKYDERLKRSGKVVLQCAEEFVGSCGAMCPVKEQNSRSKVSEFEKRPLGDEKAVPVPELMVKKYVRSAAAVSRPACDEVRPPHVLERTIDYLVTNILTDKTHPFEDVYDFINDRCRCIRQDLALQGAQTNDATLAVLEKTVRFHILSEHRLTGKDVEVFDTKMNMEQLQKCLTSTRLVYDARREAGFVSQNEPEFRSYQILCFPSEMSQICATLAPEVLNSLEVQFALRAMLLITDQKTIYAEYVQMIRDAPILVACLLYRKLTEVRKQALRIMCAVIGNSRRRERVSLVGLVDILGFEDGKQASEFCVWHGLSGDGEAILLDPRDLNTEPESPWKDLPAPRLVESKLEAREVAEMVLGQKQGVYGDTSRDRIMCDLPKSGGAVANRGRKEAVPFAFDVAT